jgi:broad specificity phosphatase PhoE
MAAGRPVWFITHPDVMVDPAVPVPEWPLSAHGRQRMTVMVSQPWVVSVGAIWSSTERKAREGAEVLATHCGLVPRTMHELGENDRSSTGYLPREAFEKLADDFFASPDSSVRGWERARDAQQRIIAAVTKVLASEADTRGIAIVSHGGVGALLLAHILRQPIGRGTDQPNGTGGHYFCFDSGADHRNNWHPHHGWRRIDQLD